MRKAIERATEILQDNMGKSWEEIVHLLVYDNTIDPYFRLITDLILASRDSLRFEER